MGTNTIPTANNGTVIPDTDHNSLKEAMTQDLVPRNSSGVPTSNAGGLGTSSLPWSQLFFGLVASGLSVADSAGKMVLKVSGAVRATIGTGGIEAGSYAADSIDTAAIIDSAVTTAKIDDGAVTRDKQAARASSISASTGAISVLSGTYVKEAETTINCSGSRPVLVFVSTGTSESPSASSNIGSNIYAEIRRASTALCNVRNEALSFPAIISLDTSPAAGNNTYSLWLRNDGSAGAASDLRIQAVEL